METNTFKCSLQQAIDTLRSFHSQQYFVDYLPEVFRGEFYDLNEQYVTMQAWCRRYYRTDGDITIEDDRHLIIRNATFIVEFYVVVSIPNIQLEYPVHQLHEVVSCKTSVIVHQASELIKLPKHMMNWNLV